MGDFNDAILTKTAHRPWPMPSSPWVMTQTWNDLLFAHWQVDAAVLRGLVPDNFELDAYENRTWVGVVPFHMTNVAPRFVPALPGISAFPELNVRTYVRVDDKPGVYFFSLDAASAAAVQAARTLLNLPYYAADMRVDVDDRQVRYSSRRSSEPAAEFQGAYRGLGDVRPPDAGTLEHFLTERYCLYALDHGGSPYRLEIHHPPWPLESAQAEIRVNTMAAAAGIARASTPPLLHFAKRQDMVAWLPQRL
jgi:uncharacterized protein YqjF (DUF2071 family)